MKNIETHLPFNIPDMNHQTQANQQQPLIKINQIYIQHEQSQNYSQENQNQTNHQQESVINDNIIPIQFDIKCQGGNNSYQFCFNKKCQQINSFICNNQTCTCNLRHQLCGKGNIKGILKKIKSKVANTQNLKQNIKKIFADLAQRINQLQQTCLKQVDQTLKFDQLMEVQKKFYDLFNQNVENNQLVDYFNGNNLAFLWEVVEEEEQNDRGLLQCYFKEIQKYKERSNMDIKYTKQRIDSMVKNFTEMFSQLQRSYFDTNQLKQPSFNEAQYFRIQPMKQMRPKRVSPSKQVSPLKDISLKKQKSPVKQKSPIREKSPLKEQQSLQERKKSRQKTPTKQFTPVRQRTSKKEQSPVRQRSGKKQRNQNTPKYLKANKIKSSIIKYQEMEQRLLSFFNRRTIKSLNLVFRASENGFNLNQFFKKCGDQTDTLIVCETTRGKILGGYTPLSFKHHGNSNCQWVSDITSSSFVFSLNLNQKFNLNIYQEAIYRLKDRSFLSFGGNFFIIRDRANKGQNNWINLTQVSYINPRLKHSKQTYQKLNGFQTYQFGIKQWQVFKVEFKSFQEQSLEARLNKENKSPMKKQ